MSATPAAEELARTRGYPSEMILIQPLLEVDFSITDMARLTLETPFVSCYLETALAFLDYDQCTDKAARGGLSDVALRMAYSDCETFIKSNLQALKAAYSLYVARGSEIDNFENCAGGDFWLARNSSKFGFRKPDLGDVGIALAEASEKLGPCSIEVGSGDQMVLSGQYPKLSHVNPQPVHSLDVASKWKLPGGRDVRQVYDPVQLPDIPQKSLVADDRVTVITPASAKVFSYHWLVREKQSKPWREAAFAYAPGDCSISVAEKFFAAAGYAEKDWSCQKMVDGETWRGYQATQHRKEVGKMSSKASSSGLSR